MGLLFLVSLIWAFSFGLIGTRLAGVDPTAVAVLRLALALAVFLPFFRRDGLGAAAMLRLALIGAVQFGAMYLFYLQAFRHLPSHEVALFTITTPLYLALLDAARERRVQARHALAALLAVAGAGIVLWRAPIAEGFLTGCLLVQASNVCFAAGQLAWRIERGKPGATQGDASVFALPYAGALLVSLAWSFAATDWPALRLTISQGLTITYLGVLASGLCFFWWNRGATRVNVGTLAAFNNAKIPLAVACSLLFFGEHAPLARLTAGGALMAFAVWVAIRPSSGQRDIP
jgi:drug/metabolite transporter (DMT)-like permease